MNHTGYLTSEQEETLRSIVGKPTMPHGVARRANALLLLNKGMSYDEVGAAQLTKSLYKIAANNTKQ